MTGIPIPRDRTTKQPALGYCLNPKCRERSDEEFRFAVDHDHFACPKCGNDKPPGVGLLTLTHLLIADPKGPIVGEFNQRYRLGCDSNRAYLATVTNNEAATGDPAVANCPGCLAEAQRMVLTIPGGRTITPSAPPPTLARITLDEDPQS